MEKNIFVLGLDEFHLKLLHTIRGAERYRFMGLLTPEAVVNRIDFDVDDLLADAYRELDAFPGPVDGIIGYWDFPTSTIMPLLQRHCGVVGPAPEAVLGCEHKYWSRLQQREAVPEHVPRFSAFDPFAADARQQIELEYPFWIKPIKAHSSFLAYKVSDGQDLEQALRAIRRQLGPPGRAFNRLLERVPVPDAVGEVGGLHCIAEEVISSSAQCTAEGYVHDGEPCVYGFVDSGREGPHLSSLSRYDYPSELPAEARQRMADIAKRVIRHMGLDHCAFNIEFFFHRRSGEIHILEVNPRISKSHCPLFLMVDGASHQQVAIELALGERPSPPHREGRYRHATKFMLRYKDGDARVVEAPDAQALERLEREFPGLMILSFVEPGRRLSELPVQDSYSYELADLFLGGDSVAQIVATYRRCCEALSLKLEPIGKPREPVVALDPPTAGGTVARMHRRRPGLAFKLRRQQMDKNRISGKWKQLRGQIKSRWGEITDDELNQAEGDVEYLVGRLEERYGLSKDEARRQLDEMASH